MRLEISPIASREAGKFLELKGCIFVDSDEVENFGISVVDDGDFIRGVILMATHGGECNLVHMYTDGTAQVGSLLYGAAWRAAKALGYKQITI